MTLHSLFKSAIFKAVIKIYLLDTGIKMAEKGGRTEFWVTNLLERVSENVPD